MHGDRGGVDRGKGDEGPHHGRTARHGSLLPIDREGTLSKADKLLRQGRLDLAIVEYERLVEDQPHDWNTANTLGDVYMRNGQSDRAVSVYQGIADHLLAEGFAPKAAAVFKKILKIAPGDEKSHLQLAQISTRQGLLAEARAYLNAVLARRQARGDAAGVDDVLIRLGSLDPLDYPARLKGAAAIARSGDPLLAAATFREIHDDLIEVGLPSEALDALREARPYLEAGPPGEERHPTLLMARLELDIREGRVPEVRQDVNELLDLDPKLREPVLAVASTFAQASPDAASACVETVADAVAAAGDLKDAVAILRSFTDAAPGRISPLLKLVEVCVDGGFETDTYDAQAQLAGAYLASGRAEEARMIFEDLLAHEPWDGGHTDGLRQSLVMLNVADPEAVIARIVNSTAEEHVEDPGVSQSVAVQQVKGSAPPSAPPPVEPTPTIPARPMPSPSSMEIDLTTILTDLRALELPPTSPPPQDLDRVFATIRDTAERAADDDEAGEYLGLARTYVEMGLTTEAVGALENAVKSPAVRFEAAAMLAR